MNERYNTGNNHDAYTPTDFDDPSEVYTTTPVKEVKPIIEGQEVVIFQDTMILPDGLPFQLPVIK